MNETIKRILKEKKITQAEAAKEIGVSRISINRYFNGVSDINSSKFLKLISLAGIEIKIKEMGNYEKHY